MKCHPLAECDVQGTVIEPLPTRRQAWHQRPILVNLYKVLKDVERNVSPVCGVLIHNPQFPPRRGDLFPQAPVAPPEGDEHEREATHNEFVHGGSSLVTDSETWYGPAAPGAHAGTGTCHVTIRALFPCTINLWRGEILTTS